MYRFTRTATAKTNFDQAAGLEFAAQVSAYINKNYSLNMKFGGELFGGTRIHWSWETDSLDKVMQINGKLLKDREYLTMLEKSKNHWVEGSLKDTLVVFQD